jgi:uncharacterized membrane protein
MKIKNNDVVAEYLHEVDLRLTGLPLLQRRELLADLAAHIATERTERDIRSEGELIEVLEKLGSPEVVANAAYEEAGTRPPRLAPPVKRNWIPAAIGAGVVVLVLVVCGFFAFFAMASHSEPARQTAVPVPGPR